MAAEVGEVRFLGDDDGAVGGQHGLADGPSSKGISVRRSITSTAPPLVSVKRAAAMADSSSMVPQLTMVARVLRRRCGMRARFADWLGVIARGDVPELGERGDGVAAFVDAHVGAVEAAVLQEDDGERVCERR